MEIVASSADWYGVIVDNEVIRASTNNEERIFYDMFGSFLPDSCFKSFFVLFEVLQLL